MALKKIQLALIITILFIAHRAYALEPEIRSSLDKKEIAVGGRVMLTVEMEWPQQQESSLVVVQITPPASPLLEHLDSKQRTSSRLAKDAIIGKMVMEYVYVAKEKGQADIAPAVIEYAYSDDTDNKRIIKSEEISINIISQKAVFWKMTLVGIFSILGIALFYWLLLTLKKRLIILKSKKDIKGVSSGVLLEQKVCDSLGDLNKYKISGDMGTYYAEAEKILTNYLKEKHKSNLSNESINMLPKELAKLYIECRAMVEKVRFSGYKPQENEQDRLMRGINRYMRSVMLVNSEESEIKTTN